MMVTVQELTKKQRACLEAIAIHWQRYDRAPTAPEIARALGIKRSGAHRLMSECRDKGYVSGRVVLEQWMLTEKAEKLLLGGGG